MTGGKSSPTHLILNLLPCLPKGVAGQKGSVAKRSRRGTTRKGTVTAPISIHDRTACVTNIHTTVANDMSMGSSVNFGFSCNPSACVHQTCQYLPHGSRFSPHGSQFAPHGSQFSPHCSQFAPHSSQFSPHGSHMAISTCHTPPIC